jgi:glycosyltransferase involved in cell wall biosynthesis
MSIRDLRASVVIPTYNQSELLAETLANLARQNSPAGQFEVIVADDGSSDDTARVVNAFTTRLPVKYYYQEDLGFRVAAARNGGARIASAPLLIFLDTGSMVGPDFLASHLDAHSGASSGRAVLGISNGYNPEAPMEGIDKALKSASPEEVMAQRREDPEFQDLRQPDFAACGFDLDARAVPWMLFWTGNVSLAAADFWRVGGFDEDFQGWGGEDIELGFRLHRDGVQLKVDADIWAVVAPHDRDTSANDADLETNLTRFLAKHPEPIVEIGWGVVAKGLILPWESDYLRLDAWREKVADLNVRDEIAELLQGTIPGDRVAVIGCGGDVPDTLDSAVLVDFDEQLLHKAAAGTNHRTCHAVGIRTQLPDQAVDTVVITSRVAGLWDSWSNQILREASRIGQTSTISLFHRI